MVRKAKSDYYLELISNCYSNPALFWKAVNYNKNNSSTIPSQLKINDQTLNDQKEIGLAFNKHFIAAGKLFHNGVSTPSTTRNKNSIPPVSKTPLFSLVQVPTSIVVDALLAINPRKYMGEDNLDPFSINLSALIISKQITHIFNLSISSGTVPKVWKKAHVIPLHKGGDKSDLNNYRPISKLPCLAKILESVINTQLKTFLSSASILSPFQSGFSAGHSTVSAVTLVLDNIVTAIDKKMHCATLFAVKSF